MRVKKGDIVKVLTGVDRGKTGKVLKVFPEKDRVVVEGTTLIKRHSRPSQRNPKGGIIQRERSMHISNVRLVCPKCSQPTAVGTRVSESAEIGKSDRVRICKKCGEMI
ncbi:MAG TPA: 50S ribosomal protein L24 [Verrucomicrobiae bacterium]|nr:50S ribosomal protein L24 [Verrucomicrobiae bacterium]